MDKRTARKFMGKIEDLATSMSKYASRDGDSWNDQVAMRAIKSLNAAYDHLEDIEESKIHRGLMLKEDDGMRFSHRPFRRGRMIRESRLRRIPVIRHR